MIEDDLQPRPKSPEHVIGMDLARLSVHELGERIQLLQNEIARLEAARGAKTASLDAAQAFFKK